MLRESPDGLDRYLLGSALERRIHKIMRPLNEWDACPMRHHAKVAKILKKIKLLMRRI